MPIRDIILTITVAGLLPACFLRPWIGLLVWTWLGVMNPHRLCWGFAYDLPFAQVVAIATLAGMLFGRDGKPFPWTRETVLLVAFWVWITVTTTVALYPVEAWDGWARSSKIFLMALLVLPYFQDRRRLRLLLLVVAASIGYYGLKGGIWVLATGGEHRVLGAPGGSFISTNNAIALALNMTLPLFLYLAKEERRPWLRLTLYATFFASILSVLFTYSRGGVLGLLAVLALLFLNRTTALAAMPAILVLVAVTTWFAPDKWTERMTTIRHYQQDGSANARLVAWELAARLAADHPLTGGGFWSIPQPATWAQYMPEFVDSGYDAHSIYFGLLGEHGFVGLGIYALFIVSVLATLRQLRRVSKEREDLRWIGSYAVMLRASLVAYLVTGAFVSFAYFDLAYLLAMIVVALKVLAARGEPLGERERRRTTSRTSVMTLGVPVLRQLRRGAG